MSAFQVHISDHTITTPGDAPNVLVAMNPAALRSELHRLVDGGTVIVNTDSFEERNLTKAGYRSDPLTDGSLDQYKVYEVPMTTLTKDTVAPLGVKPRDAERSKNFFALGLVSWMYTRPSEPTMAWIDEKFRQKPQIAAANRAAFGAGHAFGETAELFEHPYLVRPAAHQPGTYTNITGNTALAWGLVAAGQLAGLEVFLGGYPITPASDILHELSRHKNFGIRTLQAEDEIAGIGAALGAAIEAARIGGIEKADGSGNISYDPANHEHMVRIRADKVAGIATDIPPVEVTGDVDDAELLVVGWGSTWGAIDGGVNRCQVKGHKVAHAHLTHLNPFPANLGEVLARYPKVVVPELNLGQLSKMLRAEFLVDARSVNKVQGLPFTASELEAAFLKEMGS